MFSMFAVPWLWLVLLDDWHVQQATAAACAAAHGAHLLGGLLM